MKQNSAAKLAFFELMVVVSNVQGNVGSADNSYVYKKLCTFVGLARNPTAPEAQLPVTPQELTDLETINATLSDPTWLDLFFKDGNDKDDIAEIPTQLKSNPGWSDNWGRWLQAAKLAKADTDKSTMKRFNLQTAAPANAKYIKTFVERALVIVNAKAAALADDITNTKQVTKEDIKKELVAAITGAADGVLTLPIKDNLFATAAAANMQTTCEAKDNTNGAATIGAVFACLCIKGNGQTGDQICDHSGAAIQWEAATGGPQMTDVKALIDGCPAMQDTTVTPELLVNTLRDIYSTISINSGNGYLRTFKTGNCQGHNANGFCVKISGLTSDDDTKFKQLPWVSKIINLSNDIGKVNKHNRAVHLLQAEARQQIAALKVLGRQPALTEFPPAPPTLDRRTQQAEEGKCKPQNTTPTECPTEHCEYDEKATDGNSCKPKPVKENTAETTGNQAGEAAATNRCTAHKDKLACENDKTGDKQNCAWRKGNGGEPEPEKEMCHDSSFLPDKKIAFSVVSAAFVGLVAFENYKDFCLIL
ncbi:variant surface glycoprotein (VSG, atypical), putative [Trypanosoma brucei brucei TREU927]|uniref:Variant surface glycoprotein (VSG, atypical), putative n=1 Tax=Trypanosoma brucei brucei (strain 927/4 GUTat10.1) TaxID=185431 RepID=Q57XG5_TRYB2|nr:variant surface glycoprotein (VSG, atypical), putative [Trypanosoma brucei brucei TREU927]AAX69704.1 variant surface glycoprotein (VSG, atypical), putative [Trypanosoma brucei]AAZ11581.1 variant surface glycoprotein (VSG, atypical), putative [Trypanosoma brucei brucei TREU927]